MLVEVTAKPWASHDVVGPHGVAILLTNGAGSTPDVAVVVYGPAFHVVKIFHNLGSIDCAVADEPHQRHRIIAHCQRLSRPVIHLDINIRVYVAAPCRMPVFVPYSLKIARHLAVLSGAGNKQIASELEIKHFKSGIFCAL